MEARRPERPLSVSPLIAILVLTLAVYGYARWRRVDHLRGPVRRVAGPAPDRVHRAPRGPASLGLVAHRRRHLGTSGPTKARAHPWLHRWCSGRCHESRRWEQLRDGAFLLGVAVSVPAWVAATSGPMRGTVLALGSVALGVLAERDRPGHHEAAGGAEARGGAEPVRRDPARPPLDVRSQR